MRAHVLDDGLIRTIDGPKRPCDQMKLILNNKLRREKRLHLRNLCSRKTGCPPVFRMFCTNRNISVTAALAINSSEQSVRVHVPRQSRELVDC